MSYISSKQKFNRYHLSREQVKQLEAARARVELDELLLRNFNILTASVASILKPPVTDVMNIESYSTPSISLLFKPCEIVEPINGLFSKPFYQKVYDVFNFYEQKFDSSFLRRRSYSRYEDIKKEIKQITSVGRNKLTGKQALRLKKLLKELQNHVQNFVASQRRRYSTIRFGKRSLRSRDHRQHIRSVSYGTGRFMHVFSDEEESENTDSSVSSIFLITDNDKTCTMSRTYLQPWIALSSLQMAA